MVFPVRKEKHPSLESPKKRPRPQDSAKDPSEPWPCLALSVQAQLSQDKLVVIFSTTKQISVKITCQQQHEAALWTPSTDHSIVRACPPPSPPVTYGHRTTTPGLASAPEHLGSSPLPRALPCSFLHTELPPGCRSARLKCHLLSKALPDLTAVPLHAALPGDPRQTASRSSRCLLVLMSPEFKAPGVTGWHSLSCEPTAGLQF